MTDLLAHTGTRPWRYRLFTVVKYLTYGALCLNIALFLQEETATVAATVKGEIDLAGLIQRFSATLDTAAWVLLLLLFELETAIIPDRFLVGLTRWSIHGVRLLCGLAICAAFIGYWGEWMALFPREPLSASACALVGEQWSVMRGFDAFELLGPDNCATLDGPLLVVTGLGDVLATEDAWLGAWRLALTDVINAGAWILVVVVLEVEVRLLGAAHRLPRSVSVLLGLGKSLIYSVLALAAVYWWIDGDFLDFWDAALWLFAFVFIEMNVFEWQREIVQAQDESDASAAGRW